LDCLIFGEETDTHSETSVSYYQPRPRNYPE